VKLSALALAIAAPAGATLDGSKEDSDD